MNVSSKSAIVTPPQPAHHQGCHVLKNASFIALLLFLGACSHQPDPDASQGDIANMKSVPITDGVTKQKYEILCLSDGPPNAMTGALTLIDAGGQVIHSQIISGLNRLKGQYSLFATNDSILFSKYEGYGTGYRDESLLLFSARDGKLRKVFQGPGDAYSGHGDFYTRSSQINLLPTEMNPPNIELTVELAHYRTQDDMDNGTPYHTETSRKIYKFDSKLGKYCLGKDDK